MRVQRAGGSLRHYRPKLRQRGFCRSMSCLGQRVDRAGGEIGEAVRRCVGADQHIGAGIGAGGQRGLLSFPGGAQSLHETGCATGADCRWPDPAGVDGHDQVEVPPAEYLARAIIDHAAVNQHHRTIENWCRHTRQAATGHHRAVALP